MSQVKLFTQIVLFFSIKKREKLWANYLSLRTSAMDLVITESLCVYSLVRIVGIIFTKTLLHMYPIAIEI